MWIWLAVAGVAAIGELLSYDLFLAPVAVAALITAVVALLLPVTLQTGIFALLALLGILFLRPVLRHALGLDTRTPVTAVGALSHIVGRRGIVIKTVDSLGGQIRVGEGEFWTARPFDPAQTLAPGDEVEVLLVEGVAALVEAVPMAVLAQEIGPSRPIEKGIAS